MTFSGDEDTFSGDFVKAFDNFETISRKFVKPFDNFIKVFDDFVKKSLNVTTFSENFVKKSLTIMPDFASRGHGVQSSMFKVFVI